MKQYHHLIPHTKWIKDLNIRPETIKLEENIHGTLFDIYHSKILRYPPPRAIEIKTKVNKWDLIKSFCMAKETINKIKRQPSEWEKINKTISQQNNWQRINLQKIQAAHVAQKQKNHPIKKWTDDLNRHFSENIQMANKHEKMLNIAHY